MTKQRITMQAVAREAGVTLMTVLPACASRGSLTVGGQRQFYGTIIERSRRGSPEYVVIDFHMAYDLPGLRRARPF
jgi:hypothetical protein